MRKAVVAAEKFIDAVPDPASNEQAFVKHMASSKTGAAAAASQSKTLNDAINKAKSMGEKLLGSEDALMNIKQPEEKETPVGQKAQSLLKRMEGIVAIQALITLATHPDILTPQGKKYRDNLRVVMNQLKLAGCVAPKKFLELTNNILENKRAATKSRASQKGV